MNACNHKRWYAIICASLSLNLMSLSGLAEDIQNPKQPKPSVSKITTHQFVSSDKDELLQGYFLLYGLSADESQVDQIFLIKNGSTRLKSLIKEIASDSKALHAKLGQLKSKKSTGLAAFKMDVLPSLEKETRKAIAAEKQKRILMSAERVFEIELLLSQYEGLSYGHNLMKTLIPLETDPYRKNLLIKHSKTWKLLRDKVAHEIYNK